MLSSKNDVVSRSLWRSMLTHDTHVTCVTYRRVSTDNGVPPYGLVNDILIPVLWKSSAITFANDEALPVRYYSR